MPYKDQDTAVASVFAEQCTSAARNRLYAARLRKVRRPALARLPSAISTAEDIQFRRMSMHMRGKTGDTTAHLAALGYKTYDDVANGFPKLARRFGREGHSNTAEAFEQFGEVAKYHYDRISETVDSASGETPAFYLCQVCGTIAADLAPTRCPVCGAIEAKVIEA